MGTIKEKLKTIANILLGFGVFLVFNENPKNFAPNIIGLACFVLLIYINKDNND